MSVLDNMTQILAAIDAIKAAGHWPKADPRWQALSAAGTEVADAIGIEAEHQGIPCPACNNTSDNDGTPVDVDQQGLFG